MHHNQCVFRNQPSQVGGESGGFVCILNGGNARIVRQIGHSVQKSNIVLVI